MRPVLQIRVSAELLRSLRERAKRDDVSVGDLYRHFLREGLARPAGKEAVESDTPFGAREARGSTVNF